MFVSYTGADEVWATWVAAALEAEGQTVAVQAWDSPAGTNVVAWINKQMGIATRTVAICSRSYFASHWCTQEWAGALAGNTLTPLRVEDCAIPPVLATIGYRDLHGIDETTARRRLVEALGLATPSRVSAGFPGRPTPQAAAVFPGRTPPDSMRQGKTGVPGGGHEWAWLSHPPAISVPPQRWRIGLPPRVADHFQHRPAVDQLDQATADGGTVVLCQVLAGMGGVGKTQLAAYYAHQAWDSGTVEALVWVTATSREAIHTAYAHAAVRICGADPTDPEAAAEIWLGWLADTDTPWLVVLDDLTDPADLAGLWPPLRSGGRVLVTTRRRDAALTGSTRHRINVGLFTPTEAATYLLAHHHSEDPDQIAALAADLGYLPLALSQAAAYMLDLDLDCAVYRQRLADRSRTLADLTPDTGLPDDQQTTIAAAWALSIDRANQLRPAGLARPLLELASLLDPNGIPDTAFTSPPVLAHLAAARPNGPLPTADDAHDALRALHRLSLIDHTLSSPAQAVRIHQLIQRAVRDTLPSTRLHALACTAADTLLHVWPTIDRDGSLTQTLRANSTSLHTVTSDALCRPGLHGVLFRAGASLGEAGLPTAATDHFQHLYHLAHHHHGPDHPDTLSTRANLAYWRGQTGDPAGAAAAFEHLLTDTMRVLGPDHPHTLTSRANLARWRGQAGNPAGAVAAFEQLLTNTVRVLGPDHPDTLVARHNLADWRGRAGDPAGAATACMQLLTDTLRILGPDHPRTLATRGSIARWRGESGDAAAAVTALEQLLADRLRVLGPDHPDTLVARHNLADWRGRAGDPAGAATACMQLLTDTLRILGPDHPHTLATRGSIARWRGETASSPVGAADGLAAVDNHVPLPERAAVSEDERITVEKGQSDVTG